MKPIYHILICCLLGLSLSGYSQDINPVGKYSSVAPKKIKYELTVNIDDTYKCLVISIKHNVVEWMEGAWTFDDSILILHGIYKPSAKYRLKRTDNDIIEARCSLMWSRPRNPKRKKFLLKKEQLK